MVLFLFFQNDSDCLLDIISNAAQHPDVVKQILCVYQAFMVYVVNSWRSPDQDEKCCEKLQKLFSKYNNIVDAVMVVSVFQVMLMDRIFYVFVLILFSRKWTRLPKRRIKGIKKINSKQLVEQLLNLSNQQYIWTLMSCTSFFLY